MTIQEIKSKQVEILDEIRFIHKNSHSTNRMKCRCKDCLQIRELGIKYEELANKRRRMRLADQIKIQDEQLKDIILRKYNLTKEDLEYLLIDNFMTREEACITIGVSISHLARMCKRHGMYFAYVQAERARRHGYYE